MPTHKPRNPRRGHYGTPGSTIQGDERAQIIAWIREGVTRNDIVRRCGRSPSTISGIAKAEGLEFAKRTMVKAATEARQIDLRSRRAEMMETLLDDAMRLRGQIWEPTTLHAFGGKNNTHNSIDLVEPVFADKLKLMQATVAAVGRHLDLANHDADAQADTAKSLLAKFGRALGVTGPE
jgi:hypothetical protein